MCCSTKICIPQEYICDGENDCPEEDDESLCLALHTQSNKLVERHFYILTVL